MAAVDLDGDGRAEVITGAGPGGGPHVRVFDLADPANPVELDGFFAYNPAFDGGVFVAGGNVSGDGVAELVTGAGAGGQSHVRVFEQIDAPGTPTETTGFFAYRLDFTGGVRVAVGDTDGDGVGEVITGAGPGGGPHVRAFEIAGGSASATPLSFFAYDPGFMGGVFVGGRD